MRIWDRVRLGEGSFISRDFMPQVIIADGLGEAVLAGHKAEYPLCAPPFDAFVIEMRPSPWNFHLQIQETGENNKAIGMCAVFNVVKTEKQMAELMEIKEQYLTDHDKDVFRRLRQGDGWAVQLTIEYEFPSFVMPAYGLLLGVDAQGRLMEKVVASLQWQRAVEDDNDPEWWAAWMPAEAALMAVSLMNCSNVGYEDEAPYRRQEKRRLARADLPLIQHKRLVIKPHTSTKRSRTGDPDESRGVGIHIVRGHFKTYTDEAPLFGNMTGTWWWQPAVRGTAPRFVVKDYEVQQ